MTSKQAALVGQLLTEIFPGYTIKSEVPIKVGRTTLYVDFMIPSLKLAVEIDGRQHFEKVPFFTATNAEFERLCNRDRQKTTALSEINYTLIRIRFDENVNKESLKKRIRDACL